MAAEPALDSRNRRNVKLLTSVTARVLGYQGNRRTAHALRFAPIRSVSFRMPRRDRAVGTGGRRDTGGDREWEAVRPYTWVKFG